MKKDSDGICCLNPFCYDEVSDVPEKNHFL